MEGSAIVIYLHDLMDRGELGLSRVGVEEMGSLLEFPGRVFGLGYDGREEDKVVLAAFL